jgi:hypothetical protein
MQAQARSSDNWIQLKFTVDKGESFGVVMTLNNHTKIERFSA